MAGIVKDLRTFSVAVNALFKTAFQGSTADVTAQFTTVIPMSTKRVEFPIADTVGPLREWKGSRIVTSIMRSSYEISTKKFEKTLSLSVEDAEDDNLDVYMPAIRTLAAQTAAWRSQQVHRAIEQNGICYDGQPFFSATHPEHGLAASNFAPGASPAWYVVDVTKPLKPFLWGERVAPTIKPKTADSDDNVFWRDEYIWGVRARGGPGYGLWQSAFKSKQALDASAFEDAITAMRGRTDDEGETLDVTPSLVIVPPALEWDARRLFGRAVDEEGLDNLHLNGIKVLVSNRLTGV